MKVEITPQPRRRRVGRILVNLGCVVVSLVALGFILPAAFGLERYVIAGGSMTGSISKGSVVFEEVVPVSALSVGDVITYVPPAESGVQNLVTHRIVSIKGDTFRTKGDANAAVDPWTFQLDGPTQPRVVQHVPYVGYPILALQDRATRVLVVGVPAALVALYSLVGVVAGLRRRSPAPAPAGVTAAAPPVPGTDTTTDLRIPQQATGPHPGAVRPAAPTAPSSPVRPTEPVER